MIGVLVNPVAGIGGPAGLSGSDGEEVQRRAQLLGSRSRSSERMGLALNVLAERHGGIEILTAAGAMGEDTVRAAGLRARVAYTPQTAAGSAAAHGTDTGWATTSAADTRAAATALAEAGATLVLFSGGDGTARDVADALPESVAGLGVPSGVKMYSGVFAVAPRAAGATAAAWLDGTVPTVLRDVLDIDEEALRHERVAARLYGSMRVPVIAGRTQARKTSTAAGEHDAILAAARGAVARLDPDAHYAIGPGGTMQELARLLGYEKGPLGVDIVHRGTPLVRNANEHELAEAAAGGLRVIVSVIGGQGFVIGRGNQQLSSAVLGQIDPRELIVVAPEQKLIDLRGQPLLIDSGDPAIDARFSGIVRVVTGTGTQSLYRLRASDREETHAS